MYAQPATANLKPSRKKKKANQGTSNLGLSLHLFLDLLESLVGVVNLSALSLDLEQESAGVHVWIWMGEAYESFGVGGQLLVPLGRALGSLGLLLLLQHFLLALIENLSVNDLRLRILPGAVFSPLGCCRDVWSWRGRLMWQRLSWGRRGHAGRRSG